MSQIVLTEGVTPTAPSTGKASIYARTDGHIYWINDQGVEHILGLGDVIVIDEIITGLSAISTDISQDIPIGAVLLSVQANIETLIVSSGTSVKVGIGPTSDPDKYGITSAFTKNLKIDTIPAHAVLSSAEDVQINMCATGGGIGSNAATAGDIRVRIVYQTLSSLPNVA